MARLVCVILLLAAGYVAATPRGYDNGYGRESDERDESVSDEVRSGCSNRGFSNKSYNSGNREMSYNRGGRQASSTRGEKSVRGFVRGFVRSPAAVAAASYGLGPKFLMASKRV